MTKYHIEIETTSTLKMYTFDNLTNVHELIKECEKYYPIEDIEIRVYFSE